MTTAGRYGFWAVTNCPRVETIDLRRETIGVAGQEILTRDQLSSANIGTKTLEKIHRQGGRPSFASPSSQALI